MHDLTILSPSPISLCAMRRMTGILDLRYRTSQLGEEKSSETLVKK